MHYKTLFVIIYAEYMRKEGFVLGKYERQKYMRQLIDQKKISTQDELLYYMNRGDYHTTQSTVSRDLKELEIIKVRDHNNELYYALPENIAKENRYREFERLVVDNVQRIQQVEFVVVLRAVIDMANVLAAIIDEGIFEEAVGTVAGADTIAIFCHNKEASERLASRLHQMLQGNGLEWD